MAKHDCLERSTVLDTRLKGTVWYRRRECLVCQRRFSTVEIEVPEEAETTPRGYVNMIRGVGREKAGFEQRLRRLEARLAAIPAGEAGESGG